MADRWYQQEGAEGDIVISTRVRLARNLKTFPFKIRITENQQIELNKRVMEALNSPELGNTEFNFVTMHELSEMEQLSLAERHLVSHNFIENPKNQMLAISKDQALSIMVNEDDHIRIQSLASGLNLKKAYQECSHIDDILDAKLDYAFDPTLGYLTACPTDLGTGLRASVMLHLPALEKTQIIPQLMKTVSRLGLTIRGCYGEGNMVIGSIYQISNQVTLGLTEQTAVSNLYNVVMQIIESERSARKEIIQNNIEVIDGICRSYGILRHARLMPSKEFYEHVSNVRLGVSEHIIESVSISILNELLNRIGTATLCTEANQRLNPMERDLNRAKVTRDTLKKIPR